MSERCKLGLILPLFINRQKYKKKKKNHLRRQTAAASEESGRSRRWAAHADTVRNAVAMGDRNIICLFPAVSSAFWLKVDNLECLRKIRNPSLKALKLTAPTGSFSMRQSPPTRIYRSPQTLTPLSTARLSSSIVYHLWVHLDPLLFPSFRLFFIPFPVRQDRPWRGARWVAGYTNTAGLGVHFPLGSKMCGLLALPGRFGMKANAKWQMTSV